MMRIATTADQVEIEAIVNDPALRSWYCDGAAQCDASKYLQAPSFVILGDEGCFLMHCLEPGRHVVHTNLRTTCRGAAALRAAREAIAITFLLSPCLEIVSMVPDSVPQAMWLARVMGMRVLFRREHAWRFRGCAYGVAFVGMTIDDWILSGACTSSGRWFHERLRALAPAAAAHDDDAVHDAYVGAAAELVRHGRAGKAADVYNRWARFAGYQPIRLMGADRIGVGDQVLRVREQDFELEAQHA